MMKVGDELRLRVQPEHVVKTIASLGAGLRVDFTVELEGQRFVTNVTEVDGDELIGFVVKIEPLERPN